jgi:glycosyltransferase involved in cell wall biosynthesis
LARQGRVFRLRIVGEGPDRAVLEAEIQRQRLGEAVVLTGALNQDEVRLLYRECDVFTLGSFAEGVPVVLMEAMAMEIPCVSTYIDGVSGLLVPASDVESLVEAIGRLMDDEQLRHRLGEAGRRRIQEAYDLSRNVQYLGALFRQRLQ